jgi:hypothetical protein
MATAEILCRQTMQGHRSVWKEFGTYWRGFDRNGVRHQYRIQMVILNFSTFKKYFASPKLHPL